MDADRNLLFGVLALHADLIDSDRFAEACSAWAARKETSLADLLVERGWLSAEDRADVEKLLSRKLARHKGDIRASLAEVTTDRVRQSLAGVADEAVRQSLAGLTTPPAAGHVLLTTDHIPAAGERYTLSRLHATGGIGRVWLARDASLGRDVALKELRPERAGQPSLWARFLREAQVTGQLEHPGIVPVYEVGRRPDDQAPFYTMRFVRGRTLAEAARHYHELRQRGEAGPLELRELLTAFVGVCQAVAYAHSRGVLHRDLKPQNVVLGDYGEVIVLDWGLAKVTGEADTAEAVALTGEGSRDETVAGQVLGTPAYMSPEQAEGRLDQLDAHTDVYGLGAVLYELLAGRPPFSDEDTTGVLRRVIHEPPAPPRSVVAAVPQALEAVCLEALAKRPADRYATAQALAQDVKRYLADEPVSAYRDPLSTRLTRWGRRHRTLAASLAVLVLAVLGGLAAVLVVQTHANAKLEAKNAELAEQQAEVEARFATAQKAIATFHTGVSEDALLKNENLRELRTRLLKEAAGFYGDLEKLLEGKTDPKSRRLLAEGYAQLGELTEKIGDKKQALAVQRKALSLRRELAAEGADVEARLEVARSLHAVGLLLRATGDPAGALTAFREQRELAEAFGGDAGSDLVREQLGAAHHYIALVLADSDKPAEALEEYRKALMIRRALAQASPAIPRFQSDLAQTHNNIAVGLWQTGQRGETLQAFRQVLAIRQKLAQDHPAVLVIQQQLAHSYTNIGVLLGRTGKPGEALESYRQALVIHHELVQANPAVTSFQSFLASSYHNIGWVLHQTGQPGEALRAYEQARDVRQKLVQANPAVPAFQQDLADSHTNIGAMLSQLGQPGEAQRAYERARDVRQKLAKAYPANATFRSDLAMAHLHVGRMLARQRRFKEALVALAEGVALCRQLADAHANNALYANRLAHSFAFRGAARFRAGQPAEAAADLRKAIELWDKLEHPDSDTRFERVRALALLSGLGTDAKSGVTAAEAAAFADQAVAGLRATFAAGWAQPKELAETDFEALRQREDFRKLLGQLTAKAKRP